MKVFRLSKRKYAFELNGIGAAKFGNRWNSKGTEIVYTAESRALAMAEVAVHLTLATLPKDYVMMEIEIPDALEVEVLPIDGLSNNWNQHPPTKETQIIGDEFINSFKNCIIKVPSAVVQGDFNYLLNPYHKEFKKVKIITITDFPFDKRILS